MDIAHNIISFVSASFSSSSSGDVFPLLSFYGMIFFNLLQFVCILLIVFYILFQAEVLHRVEKSDGLATNIRSILLIMFVFGFLSLLASYTAFAVGTTEKCGAAATAKANVRDLPAMIGGLLGGPIAGVGAGLIGGIFRICQGGNTAFSGAVATVIAGFAGGVIFLFTRQSFIRPLYAAIFAAVYEVFHMGIVLLLSSPFDCVLELVEIIAVPMVACNSFGLFIFSFMVNRAQNYRNIKYTKDKIEAELKTAHEIQVSMLPRIFPPFPDKNEFDIYACMYPAKEVGGDFYDFFMVDGRKLCFIIGDVSDKGVPAALFMTIIKTLLKTEALRDVQPDSVLSRVNEILYPDNDSSSFATVFCGMLDIYTGEVRFSNGGHLPPFKVSSSGVINPVAIDTNYIVGCIKSATFTTQQLKLEPGDMVFLYTDGVTEANNEEKEMYTARRLRNVLESGYISGMNVNDIVDKVIHDLRAFSGNAEQFDDITILLLQYNGTDPAGGIKQ